MFCVDGARGRLVQVAHSGTVNNNVVTNYAIDKADNRTNVTNSVLVGLSFRHEGSSEA